MNSYKYFGMLPVHVTFVDKRGRPIRIVEGLEVNLNDVIEASVGFDSSDTPNVYLKIQL